MEGVGAGRPVRRENGRLAEFWALAAVLAPGTQAPSGEWGGGEEGKGGDWRCDGRWWSGSRADTQN